MRESGTFIGIANDSFCHAWGRRSAGINRHAIRNERVQQERSSESILTSQGFALISLRDMGVEEVTDQESEWRRQWRQPRRKREQNSRFCGHNGLAPSLTERNREVRSEA